MTEKLVPDCVDCHPLPGHDNARIGPDKIWHAPDCTVFGQFMSSLKEDGKRVREQGAWAKGVFPAAHERLKKAAVDVSEDSAAQPFVAALAELVQAQADATGFVSLPRWAEILERHFPATPPGPERNG
ncbi:hypothetical protein ACIRP0_27705 [Streptomyces sp. NPDC101733]|uniref:hypothetical protein n=1 Tax=unclassified Streptomyces TaxID=2593676 RepID=UPI0037F24CE2